MPRKRRDMASERCFYCRDPILHGERVLPINEGEDWLHRECAIRMFMGSVAHQEGRCSCFGGDGEDDPDLSKRENAKRAAALADSRAGETFRAAKVRAALASGDPWAQSWGISRPYWILDGHEVRQVADVLTWAEWFEEASRDNSRVVGQDEIGGYVVSTVFLGVDHNWTRQGPAILFETMVFSERGSGDDIDMRRYATWDQAAAGHAAMIERVKGIVRMMGGSSEQDQSAEGSDAPGDSGAAGG